MQQRREQNPGLCSPLNQPSSISFKIPTVHGVSLECFLIRFHMHQYKHSSVCISNVFIYCMQEWMSCRVLEEYHLISDTIYHTGEPQGVYDVTKTPK